MPIFQVTEKELKALAETSFGAEGIMERTDIQRLLREQISVIDDSLMVVVEEFGGWVESTGRVDILCIDSDANLVVVELKRSEDGGHMELQALRYAAMVSAMTFE
jgi:RecB family endonuclease NucS